MRIAPIHALYTLPSEKAEARTARLDELLARANRTQVEQVRSRICGLPLDQLKSKFRSTFRCGRRLSSLLLAEELLSRKVAPMFWHDWRSSWTYTPTHEVDLIGFDLLYLHQLFTEVPWHTPHANERRALTAGHHYAFQTAQFLYYDGKRHKWEMVRRLRVPLDHQLTCAYLRSAPVQKKHDVLALKRDQVFNAIRLDVSKVRITATYTSQHARSTVLTRHALWLCGELCGWQPSRSARLYEQLTGEAINRGLVAKHFERIHEVLRAAGISRSHVKRASKKRGPSTS